MKNMKKIVSMLLVLVTLFGVVSTTAINASAATTKAFDVLTTNKYAKTYTLSKSGNTIPYTGKNLNTRGTTTYGASTNAYIANSSDQLYVYDVGCTNGKYWAYVSYPTSSRRVNAYIPLSAISNNNGSHAKTTSTGKFYCSYRKGVATSSSYYVAKNDTVYLIATSGSDYQIMYPISGGWRIAWCSKSNYNTYCKPQISVSKVNIRYATCNFNGKGRSLLLETEVSPSNATNKTLTWKSSNTSVATVNSSGMVVTVGEGTATITATAHNGKKDATTINVRKVSATKVSLSSGNFTLSGTGSTKTLKVTVSPSNSTDKITWKSSNTSVATVNSSGKVTAVKNGTATITATAKSGVKTSVKVTCKNCNTYSISNNILTVKGVRLTEFPLGSRYTESRYVNINGKSVDMNGWQCCGYARYVQYKLYGCHWYLNNNGRIKNLAGTDNVYPTASGYKSLITSAGVGAHIRTMKNQNGVAHSSVTPR